MQDTEWNEILAQAVTKTDDAGRLLIEWTAAGKIARVQWVPSHVDDIDRHTRIAEALASLGEVK